MRAFQRTTPWILLLALITAFGWASPTLGGDTLGSGAAWNCDDSVTYNGWTTRVCWVWINLKDTSVLIETSPNSWSGHPKQYITDRNNVLAAINANWFEEQDGCGASGVRVVGMASSAGLRYPTNMETNLSSRDSMACTWGNVCEILPHSPSLDTNTRNGSSVYKNLVSGTPHFIKNGAATIPGWCSDCTQRDAIAAVGLGGAKVHNGRYEYMYFVVSEGRPNFSGYPAFGWRLQEMASFMTNRLGVKEALRLDSGGSAQLAVEDFNLLQQREGNRISGSRAPIPCEPRPVRNLLTVRAR